MRRIGLAIGFVVLVTLPAYSQLTQDELQDMQLRMAFSSSIANSQVRDGVQGFWINGVWQPMSVESCNARGNEVIALFDAQWANTQKDENQSCVGYLSSHNLNEALHELNVYARAGVALWTKICVALATRDAQKRATAARERDLMEGARSGTAGSYTSQRIPDSGGAGGSEIALPVVPNSGGAGGSEIASPKNGVTESARKHATGRSEIVQPVISDSGGAGGSEVVPSEWKAGTVSGWESLPAAIPNSGGAGGSEIVSPRNGATEPARKHATGSDLCTTTATQTCDPKTVGDAQLKALLANAQVHARITNILGDEPSCRKAKTEQRKRPERRGGARSDADFAQPNSGMSPEAANAIGTIIGVGMGVGLNNIGRRGTSGAAPHRGASGAAPRRGTFDGPRR